MSSVTIKSINALLEDTMVPEDAITRLFHILENTGGGNCLFYSFAQLLYGSTYRAREIRRMVSAFYETFEMDKTYPESSLEHTIAMMMLADPFDDDGREHQRVIHEEGVYGNMTDICICALLFQCHVTVFIFNYGDSVVRAIPIMNQSGGKFHVHIKFNGTNHYQAMLTTRRYNKKFIGNVYRDAKGRYEVLYYETKTDNEDSLFYVGVRIDGRIVKKTEYQLLVDSERICVKK